MGGKRASKEELTQLETMTREGSSDKEIAQILGRSEAAIRNLRYKKRLITRAEDETKALFQQRDALSRTVKALQERKTTLGLEVNKLEWEKFRLEAAITTARNCLQETLTQRLMTLKLQRPDLFTTSDQEQIVRLTGEFLKWILS